MTGDDRRHELLDLLLDRQAHEPPHSTSDPAPAPAPGSAPDTAPLSAAQRRTWLLHALDDGGPAYNLCVALDLDGPLDVGALGTALTRVCATHDVLRTVYRLDPAGVPQQVVLAAAPIGIPVEPVPETEPPTGRIAALAAAGFDLAADPPIRVRLLRIGPDRHVLVLVLHHIAFDNHSWAILFRGLSGYYRDALGLPTPLPRPPRSRYVDHARREATSDPAGRERDITHWREQLVGQAPLLAPPADRARPVRPGPDGATERHRLDTELSGRIAGLARACRASPFMVLLTGYLCLLRRYTGEDDVVVSVPVVHRPDEDAESLIGHFGNTVLIRVDTSGEPGFDELVGRVRETCTAAFAHQGAPFDEVVAAVRAADPQGAQTGPPTMFTWRTPQFDALDLPDVRVTERPVDPPSTRFDVALEAVHDPSTGIALRATYRTQLYSPGAVRRVFGHLETMLGAAAERPGTPITRLPLLTASERRRTVVGWNDTVVPGLDLGGTLDGLVADQVRRTPDAEALVDGDRRWTYRELDRAAADLARELAGRGAGPGELVGVRLDRSAELVIALLATLRTGAAFVPLDTSWPDGRLREIVERTRPVAVLGDPDAPVAPGRRRGGAARTEDVAYVVHTSGSTGVPKGVMIRHRSITHRLRWQVGLLGLTAADGVLFKAPMGFDISINEIFLPLVAGARLVVAAPGAERDPDRLLDTVTAGRVGFVYLTSSMLAALLERPGAAAAARSLRYVWCGGEVLTPQLFARFRAVFGDAVLYHGYGPAEATIGVTHEVYRDDGTRSAVTIGRPNPNTRVYVLGPDRSPVPVGVTGELHVGGVALASGYLGDPVATATRFVADPFGGPGERLYATGDLARYRADGVLEFVGRSDRQVKVRGFRLELAEVESALRTHPDVHQAVVRPRTLPSGQTELTGFVAIGDAATDARSLRLWLGERLPDHAVPGRVVCRPTLPMLASGKVDADGLDTLADATARPDPAATTATATATATERTVAGIWADVLGVAEVGRDDGFFDLGGHSLLLTTVRTRLEAAFDRDVRLLDLFDRPTVASVARLIDGEAAGVPPPGVPTPGPDGEGDRDRAQRRRQALARRTEARTDV